MNTRGNAVRTAPPHPTRHTRALPTAACHRHCSADRPPRTRDANPAPPIGKGQDDTAAPGSPRGASNQRLQNPPSTATTRGELTLPRRTPSYKPTKRDRATHSTNTCRSGTPTGKASTCLAHATHTQRIWASLSSP